MRHRGRRFGSLVAALALAGLACAACSDDSKPSATPASSSSAPEATPSTKAGTVTQTLNPPRTSGFVGARVDVTDLTCVQDGAVWRVGGKVTNPTGAPVDYRIFTSFLDPTNDTAGLLQNDVTNVAGGASQDWSGELAVPGNDLHCVLRVERTDAGAP